MKILFDTNVLISAFITSGGYSHEILKHAVHQHELYYTDFILHELKEKLKYKFNFSNAVILRFIEFIEQFLTHGKTAASIERVCRNTDDDQVLADAIANIVDLIITGDNDLLVLKTHKTVRILHPKDYGFI